MKTLLSLARLVLLFVAAEEQNMPSGDAFEFDHGDALGPALFL